MTDSKNGITIDKNWKCPKCGTESAGTDQVILVDRNKITTYHCMNCAVDIMKEKIPTLIHK